MGNGTWTGDQLKAISLRGNNILVSAAAGAGKTSVLVERVLRQVTSPDNPLDLERLLVVTFTEKAAAEMKQRVRAALEAAASESKNPGMRRQLALLDRAQISTIHAFCLRVLRRYFYKVDLDPAFRVLDADEAELLRLDAAAELFEDLYDDETSRGEVFRALVERYGGKGIDEGLQSALLRLHDFARTQPSTEEFLRNAGSKARGADMAWLTCLVASAQSDVERALELAAEAEQVCLKDNGPQGYLPAIRDDMSMFREAATLLAALREESEKAASGEAANLDALLSAAASRISSMGHKRLSPVRNCDPVLKEEAFDLRDLAKKAFSPVSRYAFMRPLAEVRRELEGVAPLVSGLCDMALDLDERYTAKKRDRGGVDFADLERYCVEILEKDGGRIAADIRREFDCILVDEYQDTNPLQERILTLVSSQEEGAGNVFMVGDLKQSIYRFRLAEPRLFLEKFKSYRHAADISEGDPPCPGWRIDLSHNFRSRAGVLDAVNAVFSNIMRERVADIDYNDGHELRAGASYPEGNGEFATEVHLVERISAPPAGPGSAESLSGEVDAAAVDADTAGDAEAQADEVEEYEALEKEALVVASRIQELVGGQRPLMVWDPKAKRSRPCSYRDIAILMRSTKGRANAVLEVLAQCDIPCYADTGAGYFRAREVEVALALLSVIDNPIQDIPLAAVLRSPIVGLEPKDLSVIRAYAKKGTFYDAVKAVAHASFESLGALAPPADRLREVLNRFLRDLDRWRTMARKSPLAEVLWNILTETGYHDYVGGLPGGAQRQANLTALCDRAREFDSFGRHGLIRFLRFIEKLQESEGDLGTARALGEQEDVVRLLSIHKAKGLEFPVVFVIDLGKRFNKDDVRQDILLHRDLGVGAVYVDLENRVKYPTALHQAIASRISRDNLAEEMRVLYVALTRAKEKLCIVGSVRGLEKRMWRWRRPDAANAETYLDWVCPVAVPLSEGAGGEPLFRLKVWETPGGNPIPLHAKRKTADAELDWRDISALLPPPPSDPAVYEEVKRRLEWRYPLSVYTTMQAKMSVGELKRRLDGDDEESWRFLPRPTRRLGMEQRKAYSSAVERGIAVHALLSRIDLAQAHSAESVALEAERLRQAGLIPGPGVSDEDVALVAGFFNSRAGISMRECPGRVYRELPFTMKVPASLFVGRLGEAAAALGAEGSGGAGVSPDTVIVQGVIDVLLEDREGLAVIDYKTGHGDISPRVIAYTPQVALYAMAASRIFGKPVKKASIAFLDVGKEAEVDWKGYLSSRGILKSVGNLPEDESVPATFRCPE